METYLPDACFAAYVVNTHSKPLHISAELPSGISLSVKDFTRIPSGVGASITYAAYDPVGGLPPGAAAVMFLSGTSAGSTSVPCPIAPAVPTGTMVAGTGIGHSFHITTDVPAVMYEMNPYGGGNATIPGASLLLPTTVWDTNYVVGTPAGYDTTVMTNPTVNVVAAQDGTQVTLLPRYVAITGGGTLPAGPVNTPYTFILSKGEQAQFSQQGDLSGSIVQSSKPIGLMLGHACPDVPTGVAACDHLEQMVPPVKALGHDYAAVMHRPRLAGDQAIWLLVGVVNGTNLSYSATPAGAPLTLMAGQQVRLTAGDQPFSVASQDSAHPFMLFQLMSGAFFSTTVGYGDPDFVLTVPVDQFGQRYEFYADPTFPEANLVVIRAKDAASKFDDVSLDCAGTLSGWQSIGNYEWTRLDLLSHAFAAQGACSAGRHTITSAGPFTVTVWGWGTPETTPATSAVSYAYPAGMGVAPVNTVVVPAVAQ